MIEDNYWTQQALEKQEHEFDRITRRHKFMIAGTIADTYFCAAHLRWVLFQLERLKK
jgi:hypothetical protein